MRHCIWLMLLLCSHVAFGAIARTGTPTSADCATSATTCPVSYSPVAGHGLLVYVQNNGTATVSSVTDNAAGGSSTYSSIFSGACNTTAGSYNCGLFVACNVKAATTITGNFSVADSGAIIVSEYTGQLTASCADVVSTSATGTGTAATAGTTATTAQADELVVGAFLADGANAYSGSGSYTTLKSQGCSVCGSEIGLVDRIVAATGTFAATATIAASTTWAGRTATIKAAAAAAGNKPHAIIF
jgi:hypothetical protein